MLILLCVKTRVDGTHDLIRWSASLGTLAYPCRFSLWMPLIASMYTINLQHLGASNPLPTYSPRLVMTATHVQEGSGSTQLLPFPYKDISGMCWSVSGRFPYQCWGVALCVSFYAYLMHSFGWMTSLQCGTMCPITWQTTSAWWQPASPAVTWAVSHVYLNDIKCYFVEIPIFALWLCMWVACIAATHTMLNDNNVPAEVLLIACQNGNHNWNTVVSVCGPSMPGPGQEGLACQTSCCENNCRDYLIWVAANRNMNFTWFQFGHTSQNDSQIFQTFW